MKQKGLDISLLLVSLLFVGAVVGLMRGLTKEVEINKKHFSVALTHGMSQELAPEDIMRSLQPLLASRNIGMLVGAVNQFSSQTMCAVASIIARDTRSPLAQEDKLSFLLMLAHYNSMLKPVQFKLFDLMVRAHLFNQNSPSLLGAAKKDYMAILPSFLAWMQREKSMVSQCEKSTFFNYIEERFLIDEALYSAIEQNDLHSLEQLSACGMRIDSQKASDLLIHVVYDRKKSTFIPFLIHRGADVNCVGPDRYTVLSKAVFYNDSITTRTLLEAGADVDLQVDPTIGSARHIARANGNKELEKLLNAYGTKG